MSVIVSYIFTPVTLFGGLLAQFHKSYWTDFNLILDGGGVSAQNTSH